MTLACSDISININKTVSSGVSISVRSSVVWYSYSIHIGIASALTLVFSMFADFLDPKGLNM